MGFLQAVFPIDIMFFRDFIKIQEKRMLGRLILIKVEGIRVG